MINLLTFVFSFKFTLKASIIGKFLKERSKLWDDLVTKRKTSLRKMCCKHHFKLWAEPCIHQTLLCNFGIQLHICGLISLREILWNCKKTGIMLCQNWSSPKGSAPIKPGMKSASIRDRLGWSVKTQSRLKLNHRNYNAGDNEIIHHCSYFNRALSKLILWIY